MNHMTLPANENTKITAPNLLLYNSVAHLLASYPFLTVRPNIWALNIEKGGNRDCISTLPRQNGRSMPFLFTTNEILQQKVPIVCLPTVCTKLMKNAVAV